MSIKQPRLIDRLRSLRTRHHEIDSRIRDEMKRPAPDPLRIQTLKRLRLRAKDQIARISRRLSIGPGSHTPDAA